MSETDLIASFNAGEDIPKELVDRFAKEKNLRPLNLSVLNPLLKRHLAINLPERNSVKVSQEDVDLSL